MRRAVRQRGNIFAALFGGVALVGVLGAAAGNVLQGPVTTIQRVTQTNIAKNNLMLSARVLISAATDADNDGFNEPPAWRVAGASPAPAGGGLLPSDLGLALTDPWGTQFGYCVWDHGATTASANRLGGDNTAGAVTQMLVAVIAAGANKQFETSCAAYVSGPVDVSSSAGSDDLVFKYSYAEAAAASGGVWRLNPSDANEAQLPDGGGSVKITADRSGGILSAVAVSASMVSAPGSANDTLSIGGGLLLDTGAGGATVCSAGQAGSLRLDAAKTGLEICDGSAFATFRAAPADGDKGDITVSGSGDAWTIDAGAVTFGKVQDIATGRLLGRSSAGSGSIEEITIGTGLDLSGGVLSATLTAEDDPQTGTLSPSKWCAANAAGTAIDCTQDAPAVAVADGEKGDITVSGGGANWTIDAGAVSFSKVQNIASGRVLGRSSAGSGSVEEISIGTGLDLSGGVLSATLTAEDDPQVGAVTSGKWCRGNGSAVVCDADEPGSVPIARKWRVYKTNAAAVGNYVNELRVFDAGGVVGVTAGMLSQSGLISFSASLLLDGNTVTANGFHVDSSPAGSWLEIDFGAGNEKALTKWEFSTSGTVYATWDVQYYDGAAWVPVYQGFSFTTGAGWKTAQKQVLAWQ